MRGIRSALVWIALLTILSACSSPTNNEGLDDQSPPLECIQKSPGGEDETDGGVGGTGKVPDQCGD